VFDLIPEHSKGLAVRSMESPVLCKQLSSTLFAKPHAISRQKNLENYLTR
jgi:hypothetical protein